MRLSPESTDVVEQTAGVVAEHAEAISTLFYADMFEAHPELFNVFNRANQAIGEQPKALAASVVAFAVHLIDPDAPDFTPVMRRIAHKHVSLGIQASEYLVVGRYLLAAVKKVLGDAITPEVASAWDEVYWLFATALIAEEGKLYAEGGTDPDHPWGRYRVVERFEESGEVFSLLLAPVDGQVPAHRTGQYVAIAVDLPDGLRQPRQYTISSGPRGDSLRVTIKRVRGVDGMPDGQVSGWLYENAQPGTILDVSQPAGDVVLDETDVPLVLVSAGIGITPVAAIMEDLSRRQPERTVRLFHADKSHAHHALYDGLRRQVLAMPDARAQNWYEKDAEIAPTLHPAKSGFMNLSDVELPEEAQVFMCGPLPFMQSARRSLIDQGVPSENIHYEVFGPDLWAQQPA
ncbi:globin domain-containing protein [Nesterenkonia sp. LB17]|uniref:globin domain-containing protein n=1 Tax=unclassified Nesterenkonia TaxID=2629769 RepID=UPI001F4CEC66|nr:MULTISPECIES: globin domain-containing protein [unclassified Nesterenkonia]MCH8562659.1 globin domain-containing protein [Nesterenkonia sp. YGD6]MCH8565709.1 globin domain-containing protein [Nesterenkonia sp. LB17]MCH8570502.1 globin domain-containing protein [Nesterenkonia sp. AY15]